MFYKPEYPVIPGNNYKSIIIARIENIIQWQWRCRFQTGVFGLNNPFQVYQL